jgi:hypothetical protein
LDLTTGRVEKDAVIEGPLAAFLSLPHHRPEMKPAERARFLRALPEIVTPKLPHEIMRLYYPHLNSLGHPEGWDALLDAVVLCDLALHELPGTDVGDALLDEHPICWVLPYTSDPTDATNQGKSLFSENLANALVPSLGKGSKMSRKVDAPSQRMIAAQLRRCGILCLDEVVLPSADSGHFLDAAGLQALATGQSVTPGEAFANADALAAEHPLCLSGKFAEDSDDLRNRTFASFLGAISKDGGCTPEQLADLKALRVAVQIRLSARLWLHRNDFINRMRRAKLVQNLWRHDAHATVAALLLDGRTEPIKAYLAAATSHMKSQGDGAVDTGLKALAGVTSGFSPRYYWENCIPLTLTMMAMACDSGEKLRLPLALRNLVEDGNRRHLDRELRGTKEAVAAQKLADDLRNGPYHRQDAKGESWTMTLVDKANSDLWNEKKSKTVPYVLVTHNDPAAKTMKTKTATSAEARVGTARASVQNETSLS